MNQLMFSAARSLSIAGMAAPIIALSQTYPTKPVRVVMAVSGGAEIIARVVGQKLSESLGQPVILEIQSGAAGAVGAEMVSKALPDGHTLLLAVSSSQIMRPHLTRNTPYDPVKDFTPIIKVAEAVLCVAADPAAPFGTLKEMVDYARKNPGKLSYGTSGIGTVHHLAAELIRQLTNIDIVHVPYKTAPQVITDVMAGRIPVAFTILATITPNVKSGKIKLLAIYNTRRFHLIPDVPTVTEEIPGYEPPPSWMGYFGPGGLPQPMVLRLNGELVKIFKDPELQARADGIGFMLTTSTPEEFAATLKRDLATVGRIVKSAGINPE
jgi:tripartite-type tricarboxylate transporter receptor subunit TctC